MKEMTPETQEQMRPRVIIELKIVVNRGDVPIITDPYGGYEEVDGPENDCEDDPTKQIKALTEENRVLNEKLNKFQNS